MPHLRTCLFLAVMFYLINPQPIRAASLSGQVLSVQSGNRISLSLNSGAHKNVQLLGLKNPQSDAGLERASRRHLHMLIAGRFVSVVYRTLTPKGVILGQVLHGGADINLRMLEAGMARLNPDKKLPQKDLLKYHEAQRRAQIRQLGIWANTRP